MSAAEIIEMATVEGIILTLSNTGCIKVSGNQSVIELWLPTIKQNKAEIINELQRDSRLKKALETLHDNPDIRYAIEVKDPDTDPVVVTVGIRKIAVFELAIPHKYYDSFTLSEVIENFTEEKT
jgi:hypothetical protein